MAPSAAATARPPVTTAAIPTPAPAAAATAARSAPQPAAPAAAAAAAAVPEAVAVKQEEGESLAPFRPASVESPHGRLATTLAVTSPYSPAQRQAGTFEEAAQQAAATAGAEVAEKPAAEEPAAAAAARGMAAAGDEPSLDRWALAAERPVATVGGVSGETHIGGAAALAAAHLQAAPGAVAGQEAAAAGPAAERPLGAAQPETGAAVELPSAMAAAEQEGGEQEWQLLPQQPDQQPEQAQQPEHAQLAEQAQQAQHERPLSREDVQQGQGLAAADVAAGRHAAVDTAAVAAGDGGGAERAAGAAQQPLLAAGGFNREQDIAVFRWVCIHFYSVIVSVGGCADMCLACGMVGASACTTVCDYARCLKTPACQMTLALRPSPTILSTPCVPQPPHP